MKVEPLDGDGALLPRLVSSWQFKPYRWARVAEEAINALALSRLRATLERPNLWTAVARSDKGDVVALSTMESLCWDSRMLRRSAARVHFVATGEYGMRRQACEALLEAVSSEARRREYQHLSVRADAGDDATIHALEESGWLSVDALLTFESEAGNLIGGAIGGTPAMDFVLREACTNDTPAIESIAAESFVAGRFHSDPSIPPEVAASIYREWAGACCRGDEADSVMVAVTRTGDVVGFVAWRMIPDTGVHLRRLTASVVLIATTAAARGCGLGGALMMAAVSGAARRSAVTMQVGTQIRNTAAARLYEHCGFRLVAGSQSFRAMLSR
jgi:GNAT superfamily N-acetyltransferase